MGLVPVKMQIDDMDEPLRNSIWNVIGRIVPGDEARSVSMDAVTAIAEHVLRVPVDVLSGYIPKPWLLRRYMALKWYEVYELLEFVVRHADVLSNAEVTVADAVIEANRVLGREHSGFRFVGGELTGNIDPAEAAEVERSLVLAKNAGLAGVQQHITQALALFGKRPEPDYRNAIKEAISAVEGAVKLIEGVRGGGLDKALDALSKRIEIHGALKAGLNSLYGFTSDEDGIRHPILDQPNVGEEDARLMIVTCSAAVNWIIAKAEKAGLLKAT